MYIAVDAMGGDHAPQAIVEGAFLATQEYGIAVLLVGDREQILYELTRIGGQESSLLAVRHATENVEMGESPVAALRHKPDSSLQVAIRAVKAGEAGAVVSAGNTGAMLALAVTVLGNLAGVDRPAIVTAIPALHGYTYLLDVGANIDCKPLHLVQFAVMGEIYARVVGGVEAPRVGVLSNGEEDSKGTEVTRAAHEILKKLPLHYIGYVEGRDLNNGRVDVVVTDGFTGNVALKTMEGFSDFLQDRLRSVFTARLRNKLAYLLIRRSFAALRAALDPSEVGGAPLLGTDGFVIIAHGSSSPKAIKNAVRVADQSVRGDINHQIVESLRALPEAALAPADLKRGRKFWAQIKERFRHSRETHENPLTEEPSAEEETPS